ncbi:MAG: hypothetical protein ACE5Z5_06660 [Candidatus Bathyarchaeia archaeon]
MVSKQRVLIMLTEALSFEEIRATPLLQEFLRRLWKSEVDEMVKLEAEEKARHVFEETVEHSRILTEMIREVAGGGRDEY